MKKTRKGFTLVELLIVVAVIGVLAAMMTMSSTDAVDSAAANSVLSGLESLKTAAYQMYMEYPKVAALSTVALTGLDVVGDTTADTAQAVLAKYMGKSTAKIGISAAGSAKYGLVGGIDCWFVVYKLDTTDSAGMRAKIKAKAVEAGIYSSTTVPAGTSTANADCGLTPPTTAVPLATNVETADTAYIALKVFQL